jgi:hypothetical protein
MVGVSMTVEVPEPLAGRLAAEAARRGVDPTDLAVETLAGALGATAEGGDGRDVLEAFIGCGSSGISEPFDIHTARAEAAARRLAEGA